MTEPTKWRTTEKLAWTEHDGPGRPPAGSHGVVNLVLAGVLGVVFTGMLLTDTLCPEHRAWVHGLGSIALVGCVASIVALARGMAVGPLITVGTAAIGVAIGYIDAIHSGARGWFIAGAFGVVLIGSAALYVKQLQTSRWRASEPNDAMPTAADPIGVSPEPVEASAEDAVAPRRGAEVR